MAPVAPWALIVVRAWRDADGFKVRVLYSDYAGERDETVVGSVAGACRAVERWLADLEPAPEEGRTEG